MKAREIMSEDVRVVTPDEPLTHAAQLMRDADVGLLPVVRSLTERVLEGVITDRDITVRHVTNQCGGCTVAQHMTAGRIEAVRPDDDVHDVIGRMRHDKVRRMPVIDAHHRVVGIVAQADIARRIGPQEPRQVERLLEDVSEPAHLPASV